MVVKYPEHYKSGEFHVCRFCGVNIRTKGADGKLRPNHLFAQGEIPLRSGTIFSFNGCFTCLRQVKKADFMQICKNDANMVKYMDKSAMRPKLTGKHKIRVKDIKDLARSN